ncbi:cell wall-binding repeat-containing protein [Candidatus Poriferisodalis sp.]|uniref:cell wall-binding repeat-containing protein n=1 Tax=Candidatus Poriferisodalis sp. TaxID=3101277 RepID=UPI003B020E1B
MHRPRNPGARDSSANSPNQTVFEWRRQILSSIVAHRLHRRVAAVALCLLLAAGGIVLLPATPVSSSNGDHSVGSSTISWKRYAGADRYSTSLAIAEAVAADAGGRLNSIVMTWGHRQYHWREGIVASSLAGRLSTAMLLTPPTGLRADALEFMRRVGVSKVLVVYEASPDARIMPECCLNQNLPLFSALELAGFEVLHIAGQFSSDSAMDAAEYAGPPGSLGQLGKTVIVTAAESRAYADALASAPLAAHANLPILFVWRDMLTDGWYLHDYVDTAGIDHAILVGGSAAISQRVEDAIRKRGITVSRIAGSDRYDTAVKMAQFMAKHARGGCFGGAAVGVARGDVPFDSLSAGPLLSRLCAPLALVDRHGMPSVTASFLDSVRRAHGTNKLSIFGGDAAVPDLSLDIYRSNIEWYGNIDPGAPALLATGADFSPPPLVTSSGAVTVSVDLCGSSASQHLNQTSLSSYISQLQTVAEFYRVQSGNKSRIEFVAGRILLPTRDFDDAPFEWSRQSLDKWIEKGNDDAHNISDGVEEQRYPDPCRSEAFRRSGESTLTRYYSEQSPTLILADVGVSRTWGYASLKHRWSVTAIPERYPSRTPYTRYDRFFYTVAHELGHALYSWCHPFGSPAKYGCELPQRRGNDDLRGLMSHPARGAILGFGSNIPESPRAYVACHNRVRQGWAEWINDNQCRNFGEGTRNDDDDRTTSPPSTTTTTTSTTTTTTSTTTTTASTTTTPSRTARQREVRISWGQYANDRPGCSGNRCRYLDYDFIGDWGSAPYTTECWIVGRRTFGPFEWRSLDPTKSCYYSGSNGAVYVVVEGVQSNRLSFASSRTTTATTTPTNRSPITLSVGDSARGEDGCSVAACRWLHVSIDESVIGPGPHLLLCWNEADPRYGLRREAWNSRSAVLVSGVRANRECYFGFPGTRVWVTVGGHASNVIVWP